MAINFSNLAKKVSGPVLTPGKEGYEKAIQHWASNVDKKAAVVVQPHSAADVSAAVPPFPFLLT
jgi:hypothetical protein